MIPGNWKKSLVGGMQHENNMKSDERKAMIRFMDRISPQTKHMPFWDRWDRVTSIAASYQMGLENAARKYENIKKQEETP